MAKLKIGDRVRLTGKFLRSTGQLTGPEGLSRWTIVGFWNNGNMALVNEPLGPEGYEDLPPDQRPKWRSIHVGNLQKIGTSTADLKRAKRSKTRRRSSKRAKAVRRHRARRARTKLRKRISRRRKVMSLPKAASWRTRAAFYVKGRWKWLTWNNDTGNSHKAILDKADEIGADKWDFGGADHMPADRANY